MHSILIWTPESDYDRDAIKKLSIKIKDFHNIQCKINTSTKIAYNQAVQRKNLKGAVDVYLKENDCVIFLIDSDGIDSQEKRKNEPNSYINQITKLVDDQKIFLVQIKQELESWLLVDCLGICGFYKNRNLRNDNDWIKFASKHQKGQTENIIEAESGGKGAKEHLEEFSDQINLKINPGLKNRLKNLKQKRYKERDSPKIAEYILIDSSTLKRNDSLNNFADYLKPIAP
jgi:hypothetical protein